MSMCLFFGLLNNESELQMTSNDKSFIVFLNRNLEMMIFIGNFVSNNNLLFFTSFWTMIWKLLILKMRFKIEFVSLFVKIEFELKLLIEDKLISDSFGFFFEMLLKSKIILSIIKNKSSNIINNKTSLLNLFQSALKPSINKSRFLLLFELLISILKLTFEIFRKLFRFWEGYSFNSFRF